MNELDMFTIMLYFVYDRNKVQSQNISSVSKIRNEQKKIYIPFECERTLIRIINNSELKIRTRSEMANIK